MDPPDLPPPGGIDPGSTGEFLTPEPSTMVDGVDVKIHNQPAGSPTGTPVHDSNESRFERLTHALLDEQSEHRSCRARQDGGRFEQQHLTGPSEPKVSARLVSALSCSGLRLTSARCSCTIYEKRRGGVSSVVCSILKCKSDCFCVF